MTAELPEHLPFSFRWESLLGISPLKSGAERLEAVAHFNFIKAYTIKFSSLDVVLTYWRQYAVQLGKSSLAPYLTRWRCV